jgi:hypothetical protein
VKKLFWLLVAGGVGFAVWRRFNQQPQWTDWNDGGAQDWVKNAEGQWVRAGDGSGAAAAE